MIDSYLLFVYRPGVICLLICWMTCSRRYWWIYSLKYFSNGGYFTKNGRRLCKWRSKVFGSSSLRLTIALGPKIEYFFSLSFPRTSYLLNFVEYCLLCFVQSRCVAFWKTLWMALLMAFSSSVTKIVSTSPLFCLIWEKKRFQNHVRKRA